MTDIERQFLRIFQNLKIELDKNSPGTEDKPNYKCYFNGNTIRNQDVVKMVKDYQDSVLAILFGHCDKQGKPMQDVIADKYKVVDTETVF